MSRRPSGENLTDRDLDVEAYAKSVGIELQDAASPQSFRKGRTSIPPLAITRPLRLKPLGSQVPKYPRSSSVKAPATSSNGNNSPSSSASSSNQKKFHQTPVYAMSPVPSTTDSSPSDRSKRDVTLQGKTESTITEINSSLQKSPNSTNESGSNVVRETPSKSTSPELVQEQVRSDDLRDLRLKKEQEFQHQLSDLEEEFATKLEECKKEIKQRHGEAIDELNKELAIEIERKKASIENAKKDLIMFEKENAKKLQERFQEQVTMFQNQSCEAMEAEKARVEDTKASIQETIGLAIRETLKATLQSELTTTFKELKNIKSSHNVEAVLTEDKSVQYEAELQQENKLKRRKSTSDLLEEALVYDTDHFANSRKTACIPDFHRRIDEEFMAQQEARNYTKEIKEDEQDLIQSIALRFLQDQKRLIKKKRIMLESTRNQLAQLCLYDLNQYGSNYRDKKVVLYEELWNVIHSSVIILRREIQHHEKLLTAFNNTYHNFCPQRRTQYHYNGLKQQVKEILRELLNL